MKKKDLKIAFCYNALPIDYELESDDKYAEYDSKDTIITVHNSLKTLGFNVIDVEYNTNFVENLKCIKPDLIFNIVEGYQGEDREAQAPSIYEFLGIPYTGSGPLGHAISLNKLFTKQILDNNGIKTAPYCLISSPIISNSEKEKIKFNYPVIIKPIHEGSSIGITNLSYIENWDDLKERVNQALNKYNQPILIEQFIKGREFNQAVIGNEILMTLPIVEIDYSELPKGIHPFSSYEVKTTLDDPKSTICPARITTEEANKITSTVKKAYQVLALKDYARIDLRLTEEGEIYILESNSIPGIAPSKGENNSMTKAAQIYGWTYSNMLNAIINVTCERYHIKLEI